MTKALQDSAMRVRSAGAQLRMARAAAGLRSDEVEQRLNWLPGYVQLIEGDRYNELRRPSFSRGYVQAYCKLLGVNREPVLRAFDDFRPEWDKSLQPRRVETKPLQLQHTQVGVAVGALIMLVLVVGLWWWQSGLSG